MKDATNVQKLCLYLNYIHIGFCVLFMLICGFMLVLTQGFIFLIFLILFAVALGFTLIKTEKIKKQLANSA